MPRSNNFDDIDLARAMLAQATQPAPVQMAGRVRVKPGIGDHISQLGRAFLARKDLNYLERKKAEEEAARAEQASSAFEQSLQGLTGGGQSGMPQPGMQQPSLPGSTPPVAPVQGPAPQGMPGPQASPQVSPQGMPSPQAPSGVGPNLVQALLGLYKSGDVEGASKLAAELMKGQFAPDTFSATPQTVIGPDGKPQMFFANTRGETKQLAGAPYIDPNNPVVYNGQGEVADSKKFQDFSLNEKMAGASRSSTNVSVNMPAAEGTFGKVVGAEMAKRYITLGEAAQKTPGRLAALGQMEAALRDGKMYSGTFAAVQRETAKAFGIDPERVANTEQYFTIMAQEVLKDAKLLGSGSGFSNTDREYLEKAAGAKETLSPTMKLNALRSAQKAQRLIVQQHQALDKQVNKAGMGAVPLFPVPDLPEESRPASGLATQTKPGSVMTGRQALEARRRAKQGN